MISGVCISVSIFSYHSMKVLAAIDGSLGSKGVVVTAKKLCAALAQPADTVPELILLTCVPVSLPSPYEIRLGEDGGMRGADEAQAVAQGMLQEYAAELEKERVCVSVVS